VDPHLTVVANVGDNFWIHGLYVCPDVDIATYALAGIANRKKGWGIEGDSFATLRQIERLGGEGWFALGDKDIATSILRTELMRGGVTLTQVTSMVRKSLGIKPDILPATDSPVETVIVTDRGEMNLQEFWVKRRGTPRVLGVKYKGATQARPTMSVRDALNHADRVVICPANPVTSIGPMLAIAGFRKILTGSAARIAALSPMVGASPFSGPAAEFMRAMGTSSDSIGVAGLYRDFLDGIIVNKRDREMREKIERMGIRCGCSETRISGPSSSLRLAKELLSI
jgi:LPPG:FO 2-phospho-L-lactate transferase